MTSELMKYKFINYIKNIIDYVISVIPFQILEI